MHWLSRWPPGHVTAAGAQDMEKPKTVSALES